MRMGTRNYGVIRMELYRTLVVGLITRTDSVITCYDRSVMFWTSHHACLVEILDIVGWPLRNRSNLASAEAVVIASRIVTWTVIHV